MSCNNVNNIVLFGVGDGAWTLLSPQCVIPFNLNGRRYYSLHHYLTVRRAYLFGDPLIQEELENVTIPSGLELIESRIADLDPASWQTDLYPFILSGILVQVLQNEDFRSVLMETGDSHLVFNSADPVLGSGRIYDDYVDVQASGQNLLGKALMEARRCLHLSKLTTP